MTLPHRCPHLVVDGDTQLVYPEWAPGNINRAQVKCAECSKDWHIVDAAKGLHELREKLNGTPPIDAPKRPGIRPRDRFGFTPTPGRVVIPRATVRTNDLDGVYHFDIASVDHIMSDDRSSLKPFAQTYRLEFELPRESVNPDTMNLLFGVDPTPPKIRPAHRMTMAPKRYNPYDESPVYIARHISEGFTDETFEAELEAWEASMEPVKWDYMQEQPVKGRFPEERLRIMLRLASPGYDPQHYEEQRKELEEKLKAALATIKPILDLIETTRGK